MVDHNLYETEGFFGLRPPVGPLKQRFTMGPYSIWNTREKDWQDRRRMWLSKGIESELGRPGVKTYPMPELMGDGRLGHRMASSRSIFDPVVCELAYEWFCPPSGVILDPFAGGSVRGVVASVMGRKYHGIELSRPQVDANRLQVKEATRGLYRPRWVHGDASSHVPTAPACDFVFTCPPYGNLEVYSNDENDLSNMPHDAFVDKYRNIIKGAVDRLKPDRFACFVVGNYRCKAKKTERNMVDLVGITVRAFEDAGASFYNDIVLINVIGTGALRVNTNFVRGHRKVVKMHQNVLVFVKGNPAKASQLIPIKT